MAKQDKTLYKVVPLTYVEGIPSIYVEGRVAAEYVQDMFVGSGHDTMIYPKGFYPEFDGAGNLK